ncbi:hypothetical protein [Roseiarcus fermentans]|uniref:hypothetical protein n=1 Tax=Roseiarcus fermentans TaxID=1473586 RepID=UPI0011BDDA09|nr:hypothetical protein [Roseiarcus fermentans]
MTGLAVTGKDRKPAAEVSISGRLLIVTKPARAAGSTSRRANALGPDRRHFVKPLLFDRCVRGRENGAAQRREDQGSAALALDHRGAERCDCRLEQPESRAAEIAFGKTRRPPSRPGGVMLMASVAGLAGDAPMVAAGHSG